MVLKIYAIGLKKWKKRIKKNRAFGTARNIMVQ
jgi:hypothetical protein